MPPAETETAEQFDDNLGLPNQKPRRSRKWLWIALTIDVFVITPVLVILLLAWVFNAAPEQFTPATVTIESGESVWEIAQKLEAADVVRSDLLLFAALRYLEDATQIKATTYNFDTPRTTREVAQTLITGEFANELVSVTFIEGESLATFGRRAAAVLASFDPDEFALLTVDLEGQLFPETYFVPQDYTTTELVELLTQKHKEIMQELLASSDTELSQEQIVILASIVEREANTPESMRTVAGVFLNRIAIGMPLQADASIEYALETPLGELPAGQLAAELRELDSPYNTYLNPGLPPTPIGNPGKTALAAVINPIQSDYFYYITGNDGEFYYAESYDQHLTNIARHLR